ncbi:MAG: hypothetical protein IM613_12990 [Cytophagales bacterium]|nr:hypothetical protein [Cytophagales bacterium]
MEDANHQKNEPANEKEKNFKNSFDATKARNQQFEHEQRQTQAQNEKRERKKQEEKREFAQHAHNSINVSHGGMAPLISIDWVSVAFATKMLMDRAKEKIKQRAEKQRQRENEMRHTPADTVSRRVLESADRLYSEYKPGQEPEKLHRADGMAQLTTAAIFSSYLLERAKNGVGAVDKFIAEADKVKNTRARDLILSHRSDPANKERTAELIAKSYGTSTNNDEAVKRFARSEREALESGRSSVGLQNILVTSAIVTKASNVASDAHKEWLALEFRARKEKEMSNFDAFQRKQTAERDKMKSDLRTEFYTDPTPSNDLGKSNGMSPQQAR